MYSVYKITNMINQKKYIGSTICPQRRWREHINNAKNPNSSAYNYPLQCAFRKYGIDNFNFEILKDDFETQAEMTNYEQAMIIYYNSLEQGYNQTLQTNQIEIAKENLEKYLQKVRCKCAKIDRNNNIIEIYTSYHEAAEKNGLDSNNYASLIRDICKGKVSSIKGELIFRDLNENGNIVYQSFKNYKGKKPLIGIHMDTKEEIYFNSITEAAEFLNSDRYSISQCIQGVSKHSNVKGYILRELDQNGDIIEVENSIENILQKYKQTNPEINGERHNFKDWCKIYNISEPSVRKRIKKGMGVIEAITTPKRR